MRYLALILLVLVGACGKKSKRQDPVDNRPVSERMSTYDEDVGAFVLEDDADYDIFGNEEPALGAAASQALDWTELENADQDEGEIVYFAYDSDSLSPAERKKLKANIEDAKEAIKEGAMVLLEGHSCLITHSEVYNTALSQRRADRVAQEYLKAGIPAKKMKVVGRGSSMVVCRDEGKDAQGVNRRVVTKYIYIN